MIIQNKLLDLLTDYIEKNKKIVDEFYKFQDQQLDKKIEIEKKLQDDINNIVTVDFEMLKKIVNDFSLEEHEKVEMINEIEVIIKLLELNKANGTSLEISGIQKDILMKFFACFKNYISSRKNYSIDFDIDVLQLDKDLKKYKKICNSLSSSKNISFISDIDLLDKLFDEENLSEEEKNEFYQFILKYNRKIYDYKTGTGNIRELEVLGKIDFEKLKKLFLKYGYNFDELPIEIQENIVNRATVSNIKDVFMALERNGYHLDLNNDYYLLMALLIESNKMVIDRVSGLAFSKGLTPEQVIKIGGILIKQSTSKVKSSKAYNRFFVEEINDNSLRIVGSSDDFEKNVKELTKWGISVKYVYNRCKYVLTCSNEVLSHNLSLFQEYGFSLKRNVNKLCSATWSSLMQYNTFDIIDRFIEIHPFGLEYLRSNLSVLRQVDNLDDLLFYKLYYSNKNCGSDEAFFNIINNNVSQLCFQGKVSGLTSYYIDSYANINNSNKFDITGTFIPTFSRDYYAIIRNKVDREIAASIFDNPYIQHINMYSDRSEPLAYNFDGIRISKLKVLRVFDALIECGVEINDESFLFAILYNTIISKDDFDKLRKMIRLNG